MNSLEILAMPTYFTLFFYPIMSCTKNATSLSLKKLLCLFYDRISVAVLLFSLCPSKAIVFDAFFHCHFPRFLSSRNGLWNCCLYYKYQNGCTIFRTSGLLPLVNGTKKSPHEGATGILYRDTKKRTPYGILPSYTIFLTPSQILLATSGLFIV